MSMRLTISGLGRVMECGLSAVLPQARRSYPAEWRDFGNAEHEFLRRVPEVGREMALAEAPEKHRAALRAIDLAKTPACKPGSRANEVAFAWDWMNGKARELGRGLNRDYRDLGPTEIAGTADAIGLTEEAIIADDYKLGWSSLASAKDDWQLTGYAIAATLAYGKPRANVGFIRLRDGEPRHERADLDEIDLFVRAEQVKARMLEIRERGASMEPHEGDWCRWCPAFDACPAKQALALRLAAPVEEMLGAITHANGARVLSALKSSRGVLDRIEERLRELASVDPIPLENGKVFGAYDKNMGDAVDADAARSVLVARYGEAGADIWDASLKRKVEFGRGRLEDVLRPVVQARGGSLSREVEAIYAEMRSAGAARPKTAHIVGEHSPKKPKDNG